MKHINNTSSNTNSQQIVRQITLAVSVALSALALTACSSSKSNDSSSADSGNSQGSTQGNTQGNTQNTSSPLNATYYEIESHNFSDPDISKRYADVKKITIENGKVKTEIEGREIGIGKADSWSNTQQSNDLILAENFSATESMSSDSLMDTATTKVSFYPDKIEYVLIDSSNNNTLTINAKGKQVDLSGQKVYDSNSKIDTVLTYESGSVSEVYPQGASCWSVNPSTMLSGSDKPYWIVNTTNQSFANFSDWQQHYKNSLNNYTDVKIEGSFVDTAVGSNNEYAAQMVKTTSDDTQTNQKVTVYQGAVNYQGKVYQSSSDVVSFVGHPDNKLASDSDSMNCDYYNEVAKDYIIAQLNALP